MRQEKKNTLNEYTQFVLIVKVYFALRYRAYFERAILCEITNEMREKKIKITFYSHTNRIFNVINFN